jgi:hypothetical protein
MHHHGEVMMMMSFCDDFFLNAVQCKKKTAYFILVCFYLHLTAGSKILPAHSHIMTCATVVSTNAHSALLPSSIHAND